MSSSGVTLNRSKDVLNLPNDSGVRGRVLLERPDRLSVRVRVLLERPDRLGIGVQRLSVRIQVPLDGVPESRAHRLGRRPRTLNSLLDRRTSKLYCVECSLDRHVTRDGSTCKTVDGCYLDDPLNIRRRNVRSVEISGRVYVRTSNQV